MVTERALVAISEDRQWLVVLEPAGAWLIYKDCFTGYTVHDDGGVDTGQSAEDVLADYLAQRGG